MSTEAEAEEHDHSCKSYPVKVMALRMQWILEEEGEQFLKAILASDNLDLYNIPAVQIIIEYLYTRHRAEMFGTGQAHGIYQHGDTFSFLSLYKLPVYLL